VEFLGLCGLAAIYFLSVTFSYRVADRGWWYILLIAFFSYCTVKLILGSNRCQMYFLVLLPLAAGSIWQFTGMQQLDFSPLLFLTVALLFYCFPVLQAISGTLLLLGVTASHVNYSQEHTAVLIWLPVFGLVWGAMFWKMRQEGERVRTKFNSMESRARELLSTSDPEIEKQDVFEDLNEETQIAKAVANVFRIDNLVGLILDIVFDVLHPHSCFFFFLDREEGYLKLMGHRTRSKFFDREATIELDSKDLFIWVIQNRKQLRHERLPRSMQYPAYYTARERILSCLLFPVIKGDVVEGVLGVDSRRSHSFGMEEEHRMRVFANLVGDVVEVFRDYQQQESRAVYIEAFYGTVKRLLQTKLDITQRLDVLIQISEMIKKSDELAVLIPGESNQFYVRKAAGTFLPKILGTSIHVDSLVYEFTQDESDVTLFNSAQIQQNSKCLFSPVEPNFKIASILIVPLPMENQIMGILVLGSRRRDYFTSNDRFFFRSLAAQFGFSLENALNAQKIERLAITDGLTSLNNHRYFQDVLLKEIQRSNREPAVFSLLMIDIDHFKRFNDTYGHQAGDEVLKGVARLLKDEAREVDLVARYGGEEFVMLLLSCELKAAQRIADRIRKACAKRQFVFDDQKVSVTLSIGIANFPQHGDNPAELISSADKALYSAKEHGRNRIESAPKQAI
jgi:diguanylate cyclase (GGDEF)-like protein